MEKRTSPDRLFKATPGFVDQRLVVAVKSTNPFKKKGIRKSGLAEGGL